MGSLSPQSLLELSLNIFYCFNLKMETYTFRLRATWQHEATLIICNQKSFGTLFFQPVANTEQQARPSLGFYRFFFSFLFSLLILDGFYDSTSQNDRWPYDNTMGMTLSFIVDFEKVVSVSQKVLSRYVVLLT